MGWSIELSQYKIHYLLQTTIKLQVVADFIVELTPNKEDKVPLDLSSIATKSLAATHLTMTWDLYVDKSSNDNGRRAGLILS